MRGAEWTDANEYANVARMAAVLKRGNAIPLDRCATAADYAMTVGLKRSGIATPLWETLVRNKITGMGLGS